MSLNTCRQLLMIWHSRTGAARQLAEQAEEGALEVLRELNMTDHLRIKRVHCDRVQAQDLRDSQAYLFCAPENLASLSGAMKECLDRNYYEVLDQLNGRPYSALISAGSDWARCATTTGTDLHRLAAGAGRPHPYLQFPRPDARKHSGSQIFE